jgi:Copper binding proteins, plastocyanin/azurin family
MGEALLSSKRTRIVRRAVLFVTAAALAVALAACGSEEEQELSFKATTEGKAATIASPESADAGLAEITLVNEGDSEADLQLIRVEGDRPVAEVIDGFGKAVQGQAFPEWLFAAGGVGGTGPGESATVSQVLQPGTYYAFNTEAGGPPEPGSVTAMEVTGEADDEELSAEATVDAGEYLFESETALPAGTNEIVFDNIGAQPHHLIASRLIGDSTAEDVEQFFKTEKGKPPLSEKGTQSTAVIEGGESQIVTLDLEPGRYAFYCFITDRQGGPPHVFKGMIDEIEVE